MVAKTDGSVAIRNYYSELYGEPSREAEFLAPSGKKIEVLKWGAEATGEEVSIYATIGASDEDQEISSEFFIGLSPEEDSIVFALAEIALHGNGTSTMPKSGDSITLSSDVWKNTHLTSFLFTEGSEIIAPLDGRESKVCFVQLVPLYSQELEYKKKNGEEALWQMFEEKSVEYWNPCRANSRSIN